MGKKRRDKLNTTQTVLENGTYFLICISGSEYDEIGQIGKAGFCSNELDRKL